MKDYIHTTKHIAESNSQEEFFDKVMIDFKDSIPKVNTERKQKKLIKELVHNYGVMLILKYKRLGKEK